MDVMDPCWKSESAHAVLNTEALSSLREVFLAVHTPVDGFTVRGIQSSDLNTVSEDELLRVLSRPDRKHAFCVVRGEPGSGKSHLIKWLRVKWPKASDVVLLIRRADGSLEGALQQLEQELGEDFRELFSQLGRRSRASPEGRARAFFSMLGTTLSPDHFDPPLADRDWCIRFQPEDLFSRPSIRDRWKGPQRILQLIEGRGVGDDGARNSQSAEFDLFDIADLVEAGQGDVIDTGVKGGTERLWNALRDEALEIQDYRNERWTSEELARDHFTKFPRSMEFAHALNCRRNEAIRFALEVSSDALKKLFRDVRVILEQRGQRLVLLLEDITSFEGIDDSLIDVLVDDAQTQDEHSSHKLCPLISVVGVTPLYFQRLQANYKQRITHEVGLGEYVDALQDVAMLRSAQTREQFVARYLSAVRAGPALLKEWSEHGERHGAPSPNICQTCPKQPTCFATFGSIDNRGLFPFNATAIDRLYEALNPNDQGQTWKTPRGIIQAVLSPALRNPAHLEARQFPHSSIESASLSEDRRSGQIISFELDRLIRNRLADDESQQHRMRRLISYWGQPDRIATTRIGGELAFAGVKRSVFEALGLPWIGEEEPDTQVVQLPPVADPTDEPSPNEPLIDVSPDEPETPEQPMAPTGRRGAPTRPTVQPPPARAKRSELQKLRTDLSRWRSGDRPEQGSIWNGFLSDMLQLADLRRFGVSPELRRLALTSSRIKLEGSGGGDRDRFEIPREDWVTDGLEAYLNLKLDGRDQLTPREFQSRLARLARFSAQLEERAARYILDRVPRLSDGSEWSPAGTLIQVLLVREILRGNIPDGASVADCIKIVLGPDLESQSTPKARSKPWQDILAATDRTHDQMRNQLRQLINLEGDPTKPHIVTGVVDLPQILEAVQRVLKTLSFDLVPTSEFKAVGEANRAREICCEHARGLVSVPRTELSMLKDRANSTLAVLDGSSIKSYLERVSACVNSVAELMPQAGSASVDEWRRQLLKDVLSNEELEGVQNFLLALTLDADDLPKSPLDLVQWLVRQPADGLERVWTLSKAAKALIVELTEHAARRISDAKTIPSSSAIASAAAALRDVETYWRTKGKGHE